MPVIQQQAIGQHLEVALDCSEMCLAEAVAELERLDGAALCRRWRSLVGAPLPSDLGRPLALRVLAYKLQAQRLGDLDKASTRELAALLVRGNMSANGTGTSPPLSLAPAEKLKASREPRPSARPGTVLVRDHGGERHRVMVLDEGFAWNGKTFRTLSEVACAITGTRWNGPRFFGLRDKAPKDNKRIKTTLKEQENRSHQDNLTALSSPPRRVRL